MSHKTVHYLLVYDHAARRLESSRAYEDALEATAAYTLMEREHGENDDLEIVLVGADSLETVRKTHASYFSEGEFSKYLVEVK
jgi:hypothetical protein